MRRSFPFLFGAFALIACSTSNGGPTFHATGDDTSEGGAVEDASSAGDEDRGAGAGQDATVDAVDANGGAARDVATGSEAGDDGAAAANGETGRMVGMTAAHNAVRAKVKTQPPLAELTWSPAIAEYAQQWATTLASAPSTCAMPVHRSMAPDASGFYGENLAAFEEAGGSPSGNLSTAQQAVNAWASEVACWTYGAILTTEKCDSTCTSSLNSDGCGHYTQIVWRDTLHIGCGVATCKNGNATKDIWICNYAPAGNIIGQTPY